MRRNIIAFLLFFSILSFAQTTMSSLDKGLVIGNILLQGYMAIKGNGTKQADPNAKTIESFCFKNKMDEKIT